MGYEGEVSKGDTILVHHNVFKYYNDIYGRQKSGRSWLKDNLFIVDFDQFFLYKKGDEWKAFDKYCFVKPIKKKDSYIIGSGVKEEPLHGELVYLNDQLVELGLEKGDNICFEPFSEYMFDIEGQKLLRMYTSNITIKL
jgi:co-chaperonin GroES (HSP10)